MCGNLFVYFTPHSGVKEKENAVWWFHNPFRSGCMLYSLQQADARGWIPAWLSNAFQVSVILDEFRSLRKVLQPQPQDKAPVGPSSSSPLTGEK